MPSNVSQDRRPQCIVASTDAASGLCQVQDFSHAGVLSGPVLETSRGSRSCGAAPTPRIC